MGDDFARVLSAAQGGSEDQFAVLWRDVNPALLRYLRVLAPDSAEDIAVFSLFGEATARGSTKGHTGHTLGAAGIVEAIVSALAIRHNLLPGSPHTETIDPEFRGRYQLTAERARVDRVLSNSFGFGGSNCSLVLGLAH